MRVNLGLFCGFVLLAATACGGNSSNGSSTSPTYTVGGTVTNLGGTLVLQNNGGNDLSLTTDGAFTFTTAVASSSAYSVTIKTQPSDQVCSVSNGSGTVASSNITNVAVNCVGAPTVTTQPADQSVTTGQSASFSVTALGAAPLSYQWQRDAVAISGATSSTYTLSLTTVADSGAKFTVLISNSIGSVTSNAATLTVNAPGQLVSAATGATLKSDDGHVTLVIPANALTADATVSVSSAPDFAIPSALANQFTAISGTTYVIKTQGAGFDPSIPIKISFAAASLPPAKSASRLMKSVKRLTEPRNASSSSYDNLGLSQTCPDGQPVTLVLPPSDGYDPGTALVGCPLSDSTGGAGGSQSTTIVGLSVWTPPPQPPVPSGTNIWEFFTPRTESTIGYHESSFYIRSWTGGDTWLGATPATLGASQVGAPDNEQALLTLLDGNGGLILQSQLPISTGNVVLDGPANFYMMFGRNFDGANYIAYYSLRLAADGSKQFQQVWERNLTGAKTTANGSVYNPFDYGVTGINYGLDPSTGALLALALPGLNGLTDDEKARLNFVADAFVVKFDRDGNLVWATPVTSQPTPYWNANPASPRRGNTYSLHVDHLGNAFVAGTDCCDATGPAPLNQPGLVLEKIDSQGKLFWVSTLATSDETGRVRGSSLYYENAAIAIDKNNDAYVSFRRFTVPFDTDRGISGRVNVVKVAGATGAATTIGNIDPSVDAVNDNAEVSNFYGASYVDDAGNIYIYDEPHARLNAFDASLKLIGSSLMHFPFLGDFQIDGAGNIFEQYAGELTNANTPNACGNVASTQICYGAYLRKFHF